MNPDLLTFGSLERHLRARRDGGRKLLMPYVTGGVRPDWTDYLHAFAEAGADVVEIGLPFSDPTVDGATIQEASDVALARGATVRGILADLAALADGAGGAGLGIPLVASTYYNLVLRDGPEEFCAALRGAGVSGLIVPDLPLEEAGELEAAASAADVDLALLASPATPPSRLEEILRRSRGFVYAVSVMGTTGERAKLADTAAGLAARIKARSDLPVLLGFGISTPEQASEAATDADGIIVGAGVMRQVLDGAGPRDLSAYLAAMRQAIDQE